MNSYVTKVLGAFLVCLFLSCEKGGIYVMELQCEYEVNPLAVEEKTPLLRWQLRSAVSGNLQ